MEAKYGNIFPTTGRTRSKCTNSIKSIQVKEMENIMAMEIVVTLWDETATTGSLPRWCFYSEHKDFIYYYVNRVLPSNLTASVIHVLKQEAIDEILDRVLDDAVSIDNKLAKLARSVNWAISVAVCKAGACCQGVALHEYITKLAEGLDNKFIFEFQLPKPSFNITNGGFKCPNNRLADQHLVILPLGANSFHQAVDITKKIYDKYFKVPTVKIDDDQNAADAGDNDSSYTLCMKDLRNCVRSLEKIIADFGYEEKVSIGLNMGASKYYAHNETYRFNISEEQGCDGSLVISSNALYEFYNSVLREFKFKSLEDPFHVDDQKYSYKLTELFMRYFIMEFDSVTDTDMFCKMVRGSTGNGMVLKGDQIGSVTKCIKFALIAKSTGWVIDLSSHDDCETSDPFVADFCVGLSLQYLKIGVSCITGALCNICNRVRELEFEYADHWCRTRRVTYFKQSSTPNQQEYDEEEIRRERKIASFKEWGIPLDGHT